MSRALADACEALHVSNDAMAEAEIVATRIIELARRGEGSPTKLCDRVLAEANSAGTFSPTLTTLAGAPA
jgi:hypothetical protein